MSKQIHISTRKFVALLTCIIVFTASFGVYLARSVTTSPTAITLSSGHQPGAPTYTVWVESSIYYAKNSLGETLYSTSNATEMFYGLFSLMATSGGTILAKTGNYFFDSDLLIPNMPAAVSIIGEGKYYNEYNPIASGGTVFVFNGAHFISQRTVWGAYWNFNNMGFYITGTFTTNAWDLPYILFNMDNVAITVNGNYATSIPIINFPTGGPPGAPPLWINVGWHDSRDAGDYSILFYAYTESALYENWILTIDPAITITNPRLFYIYSSGNSWTTIKNFDIYTTPAFMASAVKYDWQFYLNGNMTLDNVQFLEDKPYVFRDCIYTAQIVGITSTCQVDNIRSTMRETGFELTPTLSVAIFAPKYSAYSYLIYTDGTYYYMKNGSNQQVMYQGSNATLAFIYACGNLSNSLGGLISVKNGHYDVTGYITFYNGTTISGESRDYTVIDQNTIDTNLFVGDPASTITGHVAFEKLKLEGVISTTGKAITGKFWYSTFRDLWTDHWYSGIYMADHNADGAWDNTIDNCWIDHNYGDGIYMGDYESDNVVMNTHVQHAQEAAFHAYSAGAHRLIADVFDVSQYGINLENASARITSCNIDQLDGYGIWLQGWTLKTEIVSCKIRSWGQVMANASGIYMDGINSSDSWNVKQITIMGNYFDASGTGEYDIGFASYSGAERDITIIGNDFRSSELGGGHYIRALSCYPYSSHVDENEGYVTEAYGNQASCINGTAIAHGLAGNPTSITLSIFGTNPVINSTAYYFGPTVLSSNATHFVIAFWINNAGTLTAVGAVDAKTIYWIAVYNPTP